MCFPDHSRPPWFPGVRGEIQLSSLLLAGRGGSLIDAVEALPLGGEQPVRVLVIHDGRGLHPYYMALVGELASVGHRALAIDLYGRTAGRIPRGADFVSGEHSAQLRWEQIRADLGSGVAQLRDDAPDAPVVVLGFCIGGRVAMMAATCAELELSGYVAFYAQVRGAARSDLPEPLAHVGEITCPGLALFGGSDELIPTTDIAAWQGAVAGHSFPQEVVVYPGLGHSFFDRIAAEATPGDVAGYTDAASRVADFLAVLGR